MTGSIAGGLRATVFFALPAAMASADSIGGVCVVAAGTVGAQKYATLKCYRADDPGNYVIRSTKWERDGKKAYRDLARFSGRRFKCTLTKGGRSTSGDTLLTHYDITNCR